MFPYLTVMYTTGPLFLSELREQHLRSETSTSEANALLYTLLLGDYDRDADSLFHNSSGSSWHRWDAGVILWVGNHIFVAAVVSSVVLLLTEVVAWKTYRKIVMTLCSLLSGNGNRGRYVRVLEMVATSA